MSNQSLTEEDFKTAVAPVFTKDMDAKERRELTRDFDRQVVKDERSWKKYKANRTKQNQIMAEVTSVKTLQTEQAESLQVLESAVTDLKNKTSEANLKKTIEGVMQTETERLVKEAMSAKSDELEKKAKEMQELVNRVKGVAECAPPPESWASILKKPKAREEGNKRGLVEPDRVLTQEEYQDVLIEKVKRTFALQPIYPTEWRDIRTEFPGDEREELGIKLACKFLVENLGLSEPERQRVSKAIISTFEPPGENVRDVLYAVFDSEESGRIIWKNIHRMRREADEKKTIKEWIPRPFLARYTEVDQKGKEIFKKSKAEKEEDSTKRIRKTRVAMGEKDYVIEGRWEFDKEWKVIEELGPKRPLMDPDQRPARPDVTVGKISKMSEEDQQYNRREKEERMKRKREAENDQSSMDSPSKRRRAAEIGRTGESPQEDLSPGFLFPRKKAKQTKRLMSQPVISTNIWNLIENVQVTSEEPPRRNSTCQIKKSVLVSENVKYYECLAQNTGAKFYNKTNVSERGASPELSAGEQRPEQEGEMTPISGRRLEFTSPKSSQYELKLSKEELSGLQKKKENKRITAYFKPPDIQPSAGRNEEMITGQAGLEGEERSTEPRGTLGVGDTVTENNPERETELEEEHPQQEGEASPRQEESIAAAGVWEEGAAEVLATQAEGPADAGATEEHDGPTAPEQTNSPGPPITFLSNTSRVAVLKNMERILRKCARGLPEGMSAMEQVIITNEEARLWAAGRLWPELGLIMSANAIPVVYTDGSALGQGGGGQVRAGSGVYWGHKHALNVALPIPGKKQTNNLGEVVSIAIALGQALGMKLEVLRVRSDSSYGIGCFNGWLSKWKADGWTRGRLGPVQNLELMKEMEKLLGKVKAAGLKVTYEYVAAHRGTTGNECADRLAKVGAECLQEWRDNNTEVSQEDLEAATARASNFLKWGPGAGQKCRRFGQLVGLGSGSGSRRGWSVVGGGKVCRAKPGKCELIVKNTCDDESRRLIEKHIEEEHFEVFMKPWDTDPYDYVYTDTFDRGGEVVHHVCVELINGQHGVEVCERITVTRAEMRLHLMSEHGVQLIEPAQVVRGGRRVLGAQLRTADQEDSRIRKEAAGVTGPAQPPRARSPRRGRRERMTSINEEDPLDKMSLQTINRTLMEGNAIQKIDLAHMSQMREVEAMNNRNQAQEIKELKKIKKMAVENEENLKVAIAALVKSAAEGGNAAEITNALMEKISRAEEVSLDICKPSIIVKNNFNAVVNLKNGNLSCSAQANARVESEDQEEDPGDDTGQEKKQPRSREAMQRRQEEPRGGNTNNEKSADQEEEDEEFMAQLDGWERAGKVMDELRRKAGAEIMVENLLDELLETVTEKTELTFLLWNIEGLLDRQAGFLADAIKELQPDVLLLTEIWMKFAQAKTLSRRWPSLTYNIATPDMKEDGEELLASRIAPWSGTAVGWTENLDSMARKTENHMDRVCVQKFQIADGQQLITAAVYMPTTAAKFDADYQMTADQLVNQVEDLRREGDLVVVGMDKNICEGSSVARKLAYSSILDRLALTEQSPNGCTFTSRDGRSHSALDVVLLGEGVRMEKIESRPDLRGGSTHYPVKFTVSFKARREEESIRDAEYQPYVGHRVKWTEEVKKGYNEALHRMHDVRKLAMKDYGKKELGAPMLAKIHAGIMKEAALVGEGTSSKELERKAEEDPKKKPSYKPKYDKTLREERAKLKKMRRGTQPRNADTEEAIKVQRRKISLLTKQSKRERLQEEMTELNQLSDTDTKAFYEKIRERRTEKSKDLPDKLVTSVGIFRDKAVLAGFAAETSYLANKDTSLEGFDEEFRGDCILARIVLRQAARREQDENSFPKLTQPMLRKIITRLKTGKANDFHGISNEHLKYMDEENEEELLELCNMFIEDIEELASYIMNVGLATMISKGKGRAADQISSWRRVTVCPVLSRILDEHFGAVMRELIDRQIDGNQLGYRSQVPYTQARVIVGEAMHVARDRGEECIVVSIDACSAFPSMDRDILMVKATEAGLSGALWLYLDSIMRRTASVVKAGKSVTEFIAELLGARQGQFCSTDSWKLYQDSVLRCVGDLPVGFEFSKDVRVACVCLADDTNLLTGSREEAQSLLNLAKASFSDRMRVHYGASKTVATVEADADQLTYLKKLKPWTLAGEKTALLDQTTYLGGKQCDASLDSDTVNTNARLTQARKIVFSLHGTAFQRSSSLFTKIQLKLYLTNVESSLVAGLECCTLKKSDFELLHGLQKSIFRSTFGLRKNSVVLPLNLVTATPPPKFKVIYGAFILLQSFAKNEETRVDVLRAVYLEAEKRKESCTWVMWLERRATEYDLPSVKEVLFGPKWNDEVFKNHLKAKLLAGMEREMKSKCEEMSTLVYLNVAMASLSGRPNPVLGQMSGKEDVWNAAGVIKMLLGEFPNGEMLKRIRAVDSDKCVLCYILHGIKVIDDQCHNLLECSAITEATTQKRLDLQRLTAAHYPAFNWQGAKLREVTQFLLEPHSLNLGHDKRIPVGDPENMGVYQLARGVVAAAIKDRTETKMEIKKWWGKSHWRREGELGEKWTTAQIKAMQEVLGRGGNCDGNQKTAKQVNLDTAPNGRQRHTIEKLLFSRMSERLGPNIELQVPKMDLPDRDKKIESRNQEGRRPESGNRKKKKVARHRRTGGAHKLRKTQSAAASQRKELSEILLVLKSNYFRTGKSQGAAVQSVRMDDADKTGASEIGGNVVAVLNPPSPNIELKRVKPLEEGAMEYDEGEYEEDMERRAKRHEGTFEVEVAKFRKEPDDHNTRYMEREVMVGAAMGRTIFFECEEFASLPRAEKQSRNLGKYFGGVKTTNLADDKLWDGTIRIQVGANIKVRRMVIKVMNFDNPDDALAFIQRAHYRMCMKDLFTERDRLTNSSTNITTDFLCYPVTMVKIKALLPILTSDPDDGTGLQIYSIDTKMQDVLKVFRKLNAVIIRDMDTICPLPWIICRDCTRGVGHIISVFCSMKVEELEEEEEGCWIDATPRSRGVQCLVREDPMVSGGEQQMIVCDQYDVDGWEDSNPDFLGGTYMDGLAPSRVGGLRTNMLDFADEDPWKGNIIKMNEPNNAGPMRFVRMIEEKKYWRSGRHDTSNVLHGTFYAGRPVDRKGRSLVGGETEQQVSMAQIPPPAVVEQLMQEEEELFQDAEETADFNRIILEREEAAKLQEQERIAAERIEADEVFAQEKDFPTERVVRVEDQENDRRVVLEEPEEAERGRKVILRDAEISMKEGTEEEGLGENEKKIVEVSDSNIPGRDEKDLNVTIDISSASSGQNLSQNTPTVAQDADTTTGDPKFASTPARVVSGTTVTVNLEKRKLEEESSPELIQEKPKELKAKKKVNSPKRVSSGGRNVAKNQTFTAGKFFSDIGWTAPPSLTEKQSQDLKDAEAKAAVEKKKKEAEDKKKREQERKVEQEKKKKKDLAEKKRKEEVESELRKAKEEQARKNAAEKRKKEKLARQKKQQAEAVALTKVYNAREKDLADMRLRKPLHKWTKEDLKMAETESIVGAARLEYDLKILRMAKDARKKEARVQKEKHRLDLKRQVIYACAAPELEFEQFVDLRNQEEPGWENIIPDSVVNHFENDDDSSSSDSSSAESEGEETKPEDKKIDSGVVLTERIRAYLAKHEAKYGKNRPLVGEKVKESIRQKEKDDKRAEEEEAKRKAEKKARKEGESKSSKTKAVRKESEKDGERRGEGEKRSAGDSKFKTTQAKKKARIDPKSPARETKSPGGKKKEEKRKGYNEDRKYGGEYSGCHIDVTREEKPKLRSDTSKDRTRSKSTASESEKEKDAPTEDKRENETEELERLRKEQKESLSKIAKLEQRMITASKPPTYAEVVKPKPITDFPGIEQTGSKGYYTKKTPVLTLTRVDKEEKKTEEEERGRSKEKNIPDPAEKSISPVEITPISASDGPAEKEIQAMDLGDNVLEAKEDEMADLNEEESKLVIDQKDG